jgi:hypothetical protein
LLLVKPGEDESQLVVGSKTTSKLASLGEEWSDTERFTKGKTFCNDERGLLLELVTAAPPRRAVDTTMLVFPNYTRESVRSIPRLYHPGLTDNSEEEHKVYPLRLLTRMTREVHILVWMHHWGDPIRHYCVDRMLSWNGCTVETNGLQSVTTMR